jgi:hypothetical protein
MEWSSIWSINTILISIRILETNIQKKDMHQVLNMITIISGNFFNANCDDVDYSVAHIFSYLVAGLND